MYTYVFSTFCYSCVIHVESLLLECMSAATVAEKQPSRSVFCCGRRALVIL